MSAGNPKRKMQDTDIDGSTGLILNRILRSRAQVTQDRVLLRALVNMRMKILVQ
jgi:hypothetical protein